jgi:hypothetical protein
MENLKSHYRRAVFLWVAMVSGLFIYLFFVELLGSEVHFLQKGSSSPADVPFTYFLLIFTALTLFLIWFVRRQVLWGRPSKTIQNRISSLFFCSLATNLLCETVAVSGLTFFFLTRNPISFYPFLVLSLTLFAFFFPRYAQWEAWAAKVEEADAPVVRALARLFPRPELDQGGAPAPGIFPGQPEGSHLRQPSQNGMHRSA